MTRNDIWSFATLATTGPISALWAWLLPLQVAVPAGFLYVSLSAGMPIVSTTHGLRAKRLAAREESA